MRLHLKNPILFAVLAVMLITSCKKNDPPPGPLQVRVKSAIEKDGSINYTYDTKWRLIRYDSRSKGDTNVREYAYTDTTVKVKNYYGNGIYHGTIIYRLNSQGLATTMVDSSISASYTYTYNSSNQPIRLQVTRVTSGVLYEWDNKYYFNSNGDLDSSSTFSKNNGLTTATYYPQYDLTHNTTIGNENLGLSFLGNTGKHPLKQTTASNGVVLFNYAYTYDSTGKVESQNTNVGDVPYLSYAFTYY